MGLGVLFRRTVSGFLLFYLRPPRYIFCLPAPDKQNVSNVLGSSNMATAPPGYQMARASCLMARSPVICYALICKVLTVALRDLLHLRAMRGLLFPLMDNSFWLVTWTKKKQSPFIH